MPIFYRAWNKNFSDGADGALVGILTIAKVREASGFWETDPDADRKSAWRWMIAVRASALYGNIARADAAAEADHAREEVTAGVEFHDIFAVLPNLTAVTSSLIGFAPVLGWPQDPDLTEQPIRLHATVREWIDAGFTGIVPGADGAAVHDYLMRCRSGIVVSSVAAGNRLKKLLTRPMPPLPPILVDVAA